MQGEAEQIRGVAKGRVANQKAKVEKKKQGEKKDGKVEKKGCPFESIRSPEHPCPNHNNDRVSRASAHQSIHVQTIITRVSRAYAHQSLS